MTTQDRRMRRPWQSQLVLHSCIFISAYFIHHAIYGKHGLEAQTRLSERTAELSREIRSLEAVRARLQRDVALLTTTPPARDMVEEIAQRDLGFAYPGDIIVRPRRR